MGGLCQPSSQKNILYTTKSLPDTYSAFKSIRFYFSTEPLSKLDAQCLIIICNDATNLRKNPFLSKMMKKTCADKICSEYKAFIKGRKLLPRQFVVFSVSALGLDYTKICILYFPERQIQEIYEGGCESIVEEKFRGSLQNCIVYIKNLRISSLVITQFCWKSWVHKNNGLKELAKVLVKVQHFKAVVFASLSEESQSLSMKAVQQIKNS